MTTDRGAYLEFRSELDGSPCVLILTKRSGNRKTGPMVQTWILRADLDPVAAARHKADASICGTCPQRQSLGGGCYVVIGRAPRAVFDAYKRGVYAPWNPSSWTPRQRKSWTGRALRMGAYGDPAAVPDRIWSEVFQTLKPDLWTGYTHAWHTPAAQRLKATACASVDTPGQYHVARAMGWRTFRTRKPGDPLLPGEFDCPASAEEGYRLTCMECGACNGNPNARPKAGNASIVVHGSLKKRAVKALVQVEVLA